MGFLVVYLLVMCIWRVVELKMRRGLGHWYEGVIRAR